jgi:hypothetical protein
MTTPTTAAVAAYPPSRAARTATRHEPLLGAAADRALLSMNQPWRSVTLSSPPPGSGRRRRWPGYDPTPRCNRPSA